MKRFIQRFRSTVGKQRGYSSYSADDLHFITYTAWHPKNRERNKDPIPYWKQRHRIGKVDAGEDAFFLTQSAQGLAMGVADGVGSWRRFGINPAMFAWLLMDNAAKIARGQTEAGTILKAAYQKALEEGQVFGSSTACVLYVNRAGEMNACNLGDSSFLLVRNHQLLYKSPSQQHYFNCPYQLSIIPPNLPQSQSLVSDQPQDAATCRLQLERGDLLLLATDGYFDNIYTEETLEMIEHALRAMPALHLEPAHARIRQLTHTLTSRARRLSLNPNRLSPWAQEAQRYGSGFQGGKLDDITCTVCFIY
ncbi:phosphatase 2C-like domain-containing protein [Sporodiniella umbellata]|nr:phosphatase 2C-like domain-containing protein [Sporodiniella umbellata]